MCRRLVCRLYERFMLCVLVYVLHIYKVYLKSEIAEFNKNFTKIYKKKELSLTGNSFSILKFLLTSLYSMLPEHQHPFRLAL